MTEELGGTPNAEEREFEDLTLAEMTREVLRQPFETLRVLFVVLNPGRKTKRTRVYRPVRSAHVSADTLDSIDAAQALDGYDVVRDNTRSVRFVLLTLAFLAALFGNILLVQPNPGPRLGLLRDTPLELPVFLWLVAASLAVGALTYGRRDDDSLGGPWYGLSDRVEIRPLSLIVALPLLAAAFVWSADNQFTTGGVLAWFAGIFATAWGFTPRGVNPLRSIWRGWEALRALRLNEPRVAALLVVIVLIGAYARFNGLGEIPAEMTSDHIEKLLDSQRVADGSRDIFFANNGGREPFQMYVLAMVSQVGGPLNFNHLKVVAALEGLLGIPLLFVLGRVAVGERDRRLGTMLGLALALFAAVGYWHIMVGRVSLRIMLTPLVTTMFLIFLIRLIRFNRREDAIMAGLTIGFGLYAYQALRMLPVVAVIAAAYMVVFVATDWRQRWATMINLGVIAAVSFAVFVPMFKYSTERPEEFWRRAQGRLLGEDVITETTAEGTVVSRSPTLIERGAALIANVPALGQNMLNALGMFTRRGDVAWLHNAPNFPAFDPVTGALLITGTVGWAVWAIQKREHAAGFLLMVLILMLIPSALALANPIENPSHTRTSGAMPVAYLLAGFGFVQISSALGWLIPRWRGVAAVVLAGIVTVFSLNWTHTVMTGPYDEYYQNSWSPQREAGLFMRGFAESDGAWGNVFVLAAAHFFDYRGLAIDAGLAPGEYQNGDIQPRELPQRIYDGLQRTDKFRFDPARYTMVMYSIDDENAKLMLETWFPEGRGTVIDTRVGEPWLVNESYRAFRIPPMGIDRLREFLTSQGFSIPGE
jgi:hypothetical protein